jgi:cell division protein FtsB
MAKNRKNQAAAIRFAPVLKVVLLCSLIGGSAIGYVWQKNQIDRLALQIRDREKALAKLKHDNDNLGRQVEELHSSVKLIQRVKEMQLGLVPQQAVQVVRLEEISVANAGNNLSRQFTQRSVNRLTQ